MSDRYKINEAVTFFYMKFYIFILIWTNPQKQFEENFKFTKMNLLLLKFVNNLLIGL